jgi:hypothetical protein
VDSIRKWNEDDAVIPANVAEAANLYQISSSCRILACASIFVIFKYFNARLWAVFRVRTGRQLELDVKHVVGADISTEKPDNNRCGKMTMSLRRARLQPAPEAPRQIQTHS